MTKYTAGPWRFDKESGTVGQAEINGIEVVAVIEAPPLGGGKWDSDALLANGKLIAAAPDMLSALKAIQKEFIGDRNSRNLAGPAGTACDMVHAAIAKAEAL